MNNHPKYTGTERRVHKIYVTLNTEYHVRGGVCVAVKSRKGPEWNCSHSALRMRIEGHVQQGTMLPTAGTPKIGSRIYFTRDLNDVLTSAVVAIVRPAKKIVEQYPSA